MQLRKSLSRLGRFLRSSDGKADSKLPTLLFIVVLGGGGYLGWQYFVPYWNDRVLGDFIKDAAVFDPFEKKKPTEESVREAIIKKLRELRIPFQENRDGQKLEIITRTELAYEVNLRYKQIISIYGMKPKTRWYEIRFDGTAMSKAIIPNRPVQ